MVDFGTHNKQNSSNLFRSHSLRFCIKTYGLQRESSISIAIAFQRPKHTFWLYAQLITIRKSATYRTN